MNDKLKHTNDWSEWSKYVLKELESLNDNYKELTGAYNTLNTQFQVFKMEMQMKAGVVGLLGGLIPSAVVIAVLFLKNVF